ncbi:MAG: hypothetical protein JO257_27700 [Deltaproteobacteria bacterium]|nr:hypothetical protein [Deltaproteobacteria bacterium]
MRTTEEALAESWTPALAAPQTRPDDSFDDWIASLPTKLAERRDIMLIVADEPVCGMLLELAHINGFDAFACETPLDVIDTLIEIHDRIACAVVSSQTPWGAGLGDFLADEYPTIQRVLIDA